MVEGMPITALTKFMELVSKHIDNLKNTIDEEAIERFFESLDNSKSIFVLGAGRSGFVARAFAMRLMHLGYSVYVVGETVTPRIQREDMLIAISGSGETSSIVSISQKAKEIGSKIVTVTSKRDSTLAKISDIVLIVKGKPKSEKDESISQLFPLGTLFELTAMIFLDGIVAEIMARKRLSERDLELRHAILE
ncbi:MAG: 6-phospho-3-hexuloisomerase [Archaeoglobaceae archaeon]